MKFTPFSAKRHNEWIRNNPPDASLVEFTAAVAIAMTPVIQCMDIYAAKGALSVRDVHGNLWEIVITKSDAPYLVCEGKPHES